GPPNGRVRRRTGDRAGAGAPVSAPTPGRKRARAWHRAPRRCRPPRNPRRAMRRAAASERRRRRSRPVANRAIRRWRRACQHTRPAAGAVRRRPMPNAGTGVAVRRDAGGGYDPVLGTGRSRREHAGRNRRGMTPRKVVVADDEPLARERIRTLLENHPGYAIAAECATGPETVDAIIEHAPALLFLDIKMPVLNGIEVLDALDEVQRPPAIVFVTAFDAYAVKAFDVSAADYLLKPFDRERFDQALHRAAVRIEATHGKTPRVDGEVRAFIETLRAGREYPERFPVRGPRHLYFVQAVDIEWVEGAANYVQVHAGGRVHFIRDTMTAFASKLAPDKFIRVHRSVIVNVDRIQRIEPRGHGDYLITLRDGTQVASSQAYNERLREILR